MAVPYLQIDLNGTEAWIVWETAVAPQSLLLQEDTLWAGYHNGHLFEWDVTLGFQAQHTGTVGSDVVALAALANGDKLAAALDGGLARGGAALAELPLPADEWRPWDIAVESNGSSFWLASLGHGVARYHNGAWTTYNSLSSTLPFDDIYAVAVDGDDNPWVGTLGYGTAVLQNNTWVSYTLPVSIAHPVTPATLMPNNAVNDIAIDGDGNKWFATDGAGVAVLDSTNNNWTIYNRANSGLPDDFVYAITIAGDDRWFGTLGGGVARLDTAASTWEVWHTTNSALPDDDVLATAVDANGGRWFAAYDTGLTFYGPLPDPAPLLEIDPRHTPRYTPGSFKGYALWLDSATYTWYLAWSGDGQPHTFTGELTADAPILDLTPIGLEPGDSATAVANTLTITASETISQDMVSFVLDRSATELSFNLQIDGAYRPFNIRLGQNGALPPTAPFRLQTPQPVPPEVHIQASTAVSEGHTLVFSGRFTDTDSFSGHTIAWDLGDGTAVTDTLNFSHVYADDGLFQVTLTVTDVHDAVGQDSLAVTVHNAPPEVLFYTDPLSPQPGAPITLTGSFFDWGQQDTHTILWDFGDSFTSTAGLTVTHVYTGHAIYTATLTVTDDDGGVGLAQRAIAVGQFPPTAVDDFASTAANTSLFIYVLNNDSDPNYDPLSIITYTQPANGELSLILAHSFVYTPALDFIGEDSFSYTISDGHGPSDSATVFITVTPNQPPIANDDSAATAENTPVTIFILANDNDPDGHTLVVVDVSQPLTGVVTLNNDNAVTYTPALNFLGTAVFSYTISDGHNAFASATVTVIVSPNRPPLAVNDFATAVAGRATAIAVLNNDYDPDNHSLTVSAFSQPVSGTAVLNSDQTILYTPDFAFTATDSFSYTISDGHGGAATALVTVNVVPNAAPVALDDMLTIAEDTAVTFAPLANDSDANNDPLAITGLTAPQHGTAVLHPDHTVTYTPTADFHGQDGFSYTVSDGYAEDTAVVTITITPVNDAPVAVDDEAITDEDTPVIIEVLANDSDVDGNTLSVSSLTQPGNGAAAINPDGTVTYTPDLDFNSGDSTDGADSFTYTVSDGHGAIDTATVTVIVLPINDAPTAVADSATTLEDTPITIPVLANDSDVDGDPLSLEAVTQPAHGTAVINPDDTVTYTPDADYHGLDSFSYTVSDGQGGAATALVSLTITPVNDPPVAVADTATTDEDTAVTIDVLANDYDVDGDSLTVVSVTQPPHGMVILYPDGSVVYTPDADYHGADFFTYMISDGQGGMAATSVTVAVNPINDPPVALDDVASTAEATPVTVPVLANDYDVDGDALSVISVTLPAHGTAIINPNNSVTYTPDAGFDGQDHFSYTISDGQGGIATAVVTVTISTTNHNPVAVADSAATDEDTAVIIDVLANDDDVDGDSLTVVSVTPPQHGTAVINPDSTITYTPNADYHGADSFSYTISDGQGGAATALVSITVAPVNDPPLAVDDVAITNEDTPITLDVLANDSDVDGDALIVTSVTAPAHGTAVINPDDTVTYTPDADYHGLDSFSYTISDGQGGAATALVSLTITPVNDPPVAVADTATTDEDTAATIDVLANDYDVDGDSLTVVSVTQPPHGMVILYPDGSVVYTPDADYHGADFFTYMISDGQGGMAATSVTVAVNPINDPPVALDDAITTPEDTAVTIPVLANDYDVDGDSLVVTSVTTPTWGAITVNPDNSITYTPQANFHGGDSFSYTISDGHGGMATALVTITVTPVNDAPVAHDDAVVTGVNTAVIINVLANDVDIDGDTLVVTAVAEPLHGTAVINPDNTITYTPAPGFVGADSFNYTISDGHGGLDTAQVVVTVVGGNHNPVAVNDFVITDEDTAVIINVLANDSDSDGDPLTVVGVIQPNQGVAVINPDNTITYTPNPDYRGPDSFSYTISDGRGGTDTAQVNLLVRNVNDPPVAVDDTAVTNRDTAVTIPVLANDYDVDNNTLSVISLTQPANGVVVINPDHTVTYTPNPGFDGVDTFFYTVGDGHGGVDTGMVTVDVLPVAAGCNLYPIALHMDVLAGAAPGDILPDILNGSQPGNFGWLTWTGDRGVPTLVASLTPPGNSHTYVNPHNPTDHFVSVGDWVRGKPGVSNAQKIRDALNMLMAIDIVVPVWEATQGNGANTLYRVSGFATVRLIAYDLPGQDQITAQFLGYASCQTP